MCGLGVPAGCRMKHVRGMFKRWHFRAGFRAGKRRARVLSILRVFKPVKRFKGLRAGKRQAWTPIRSH